MKTYSTPRVRAGARHEAVDELENKIWERRFAARRIGTAPVRESGREPMQLLQIQSYEAADGWRRAGKRLFAVRQVRVIRAWVVSSMPQRSAAAF